MKNSIFQLSSLLMACATALSFTGSLSAQATGLQVGVGYRQDSVNWTAKERGSFDPRSKVNLHFRDLEIVLLDVKAKSHLGGCCDAYVRANFDYGWLFDGKLRDKLTERDRQCRNSHIAHHQGYIEKGEYKETVLHNDLKNGRSFVWDLNIAFAYPLESDGDCMRWAPAVGFAINSQHLKVKDKVCTRHCHSDWRIDRHGNSKYRTTFWGPWIGADFTYNNDNCWNFYGELEVHFGRARRHRNTDIGNKYFDDYNRTKCFWGPSLKIGSNYVFCENWFADVSLQYLKFFSYGNRDELYWSSGSIRLDLGYMF